MGGGGDCLWRTPDSWIVCSGSSMGTSLLLLSCGSPRPQAIRIPCLMNESPKCWRCQLWKNVQTLNIHSSVGWVWERTLPLHLSWVLRRDTCGNADPKSWILTGVSGTFQRVQMSGQADVSRPAKEGKVPAPFHSWHFPQTSKIEGDVLPSRTPRASTGVTQDAVSLF